MPEQTPREKFTKSHAKAVRSVVFEGWCGQHEIFLTVEEELLLLDRGMIDLCSDCSTPGSILVYHTVWTPDRIREALRSKKSLN